MKEIKKLKKIMKAHNISFERAAREIGVSFQTVWKWMNGIHKPSELALAQLKKFIKKYENRDPLTD
jgi:transcriptional regulator with XRE-family HTH domain